MTSSASGGCSVCAPLVGVATGLICLDSGNISTGFSLQVLVAELQLLAGEFNSLDRCQIPEIYWEVECKLEPLFSEDILVFVMYQEHLQVWFKYIVV